MILFNIDPGVLIVGGAALFSLLGLFIINFILRYQKRQHKHMIEKQELFNNYQQELLKTQLETQEHTFYQIAEELHDNIGQLLSSTRMLIGVTERSLVDVPQTLRTADLTLAKAIQDLRSLSKSLNKEWLQRFNLLENLQVEVNRLNASRTVAVSLHQGIDEIQLPSESQVMLFRIVQEALHNCIRHAQASSIRIEIEKNEDLLLSIRDDGRGMRSAQPGFGLGLMNMQHRTKLLGGSIQWTSPNEIGTRVLIRVPVKYDEL